jgi:hypothetical protein
MLGHPAQQLAANAVMTELPAVVDLWAILEKVAVRLVSPSENHM